MREELIAVTGASSGIGQAIAHAFAAQDYPVLALSRSGRCIDHPNIHCESVDVTERESVSQVLDEAERRYGLLDCIVNNAGMMLLGRMETQDPHEWEKMLQVNVLGVMNGIYAALPKMIERRRGTIVNMSSVAGIKTFPNHAAYTATKFAVHGMSENLREEVAPYGIRCVTIAPGAVETNLLSHTSSQEIKNTYSDWKQEMGGVLIADDIARAVLFAYQQPRNVCVREIVMAATRQEP